MERIVGICKECNKNRGIVNKKYFLCNDCNCFRISGITTQEKQREWLKKMQQKAIVRMATMPVKPAKPIKQQTGKEASTKAKLSLIKRDIELTAIQEGTYYCKGCGSSHCGLDKSHILSVGMYKHLELVRENMVLHCRRCHDIWESGEIQEKMQLHCFESNLLFIKKHDDEAYNKLVTKVEEYNNNYFLQTI